MTHNAIVRLVTKLYAASGAREATDVDFEVYAEALDDMSDERGEAAGRALIRDVDLVMHRPSPGAVRQMAKEIADYEWNNRRPAPLPELGEPIERPLSSAEGLAWVARVREQKLRRGGDPRPVGESLP